ncbi:MAG: Type 2 DNA topoisomerase 6 subunit A [Methanonatronarchaeales archaeon]|nr:Type 2 DNA topoisomerase 6 subunit A [Methanonatronarchaeales archaeon]
MDRDAETVEAIVELAGGIRGQIEDWEVPRVEVPTRSKANIEFDEGSRVWKYGDRTSTRSAKSVRGAYRLLKLLYTVGFFREQLEQDRSSTLREMYYISENWSDAKFREQGESDKLIEDLEIVTGLKRENFHVRPEEDGATVLGPLRIREKTRRGEREIHCQEDVGEGGYQVPNNLENVEFLEHDAELVVAVETGGMRDRLVENGFDEEYGAILVHLKGQPSRSTRRLVKRLNEEQGLPVAVFTDGDPWSYRIFGSVAYGSIKSAHLSEYMATPDARFLGVRPSDITDYDLPSDDLTDQDIRALRNMKTDPRFEDDFWSGEIELQLDLGRKSEQQSLAKYGLDYVTETYLPERLGEMGLA